MPLLHDRDARSAFPFSRPAAHDAGMTPNVATLSQDADLRLRGGFRVRVAWPPATSGERPPLLVLVGADPDSGRELAVRIPAVVLAVEPAAAREALEWGADHAAELGAAPGRIVLAGARRDAAAVAALAREARDRGWPRVAHVALFDPAATAVEALAGLLRIAAAMRPGTPAGSVPAGPAPAGGQARPRVAPR
jgi:hypothetical protein